MDEWKKRPWILEYWPEDVDYIMFMDENNTPDLKDVIKKVKNTGVNLTAGAEYDINKRFFTVTGCILERKDFPQTRQNILYLKNKHWESGMYYCNKSETYKRVCFHSNEIRKSFNHFSNNIINRAQFLNDLNKFIVETPFTIISATLDKVAHVINYTNPEHPYNLCLVFILERFARYFLYRRNKTGMIVLEAVGKKEDKLTLQHLIRILNNGTNYCSAKEYSHIKGVYFNPKWSARRENAASFFGLELADLVSYPIHKYWRTGEKDFAFTCFEHKIYGYPGRMNYGLIKFPR